MKDGKEFKVSAYHLYAPPSVSSVRDVHAREFLQDVGLPVDHLLFASAEPATRIVETDGIKRNLLKIGEGGDYEEFCIDIESGEIVSLSTSDSSIWHVNDSPVMFQRCLEEFMARFPYGGEGLDLAEREALADELGRALIGIDATALRDDPGFWCGLLGDVAIGDYSEE
ncbi:SUKH-4 family immunity protein [Streptomyces mirabilis]|uniref:SUKH-4 family immunity protein n=1 Tax=Streptomyces mirabilis TaxID=68239 RepID=UPI00369AB55C